MNLCIECKWYRPPTQMSIENLREAPISWKPSCLNEKNKSVVDGEPRRDLDALRYGLGIAVCGENGSWWEKADGG